MAFIFLRKKKFEFIKLKRKKRKKKKCSLTGNRFWRTVVVIWLEKSVYHYFFSVSEPVKLHWSVIVNITKGNVFFFFNKIFWLLKLQSFYLYFIECSLSVSDGEKSLWNGNIEAPVIGGSQLRKQHVEDSWACHHGYFDQSQPWNPLFWKPL